MTISDPNGSVDMLHRVVAVVFNATATAQVYSVPSLASKNLKLHPVQRFSHDPVVRTSTFAAGTFTVPGRTVAVFY
jgi:hypothetical protein